MTYPFPFPKMNTSLRLLVIDDQAFDREVIVTRLREVVPADTEIFETDDAATTLKLLAAQTTPIHCALVDMNLTDMNGQELVRRIASDWPELSVVMITVEADMVKALQCIQSGAEDFLIKGEYNNAALYRAVRFAIERRRVSLENYKLSEALAKERALSAAQKEFIHLVSHEFRTPMAIISGATQMLTAKFPAVAEGEGAKHFSKINGALSRLGLLLDDVIRLSKLEDGNVAFESTAFDFIALIDAVVTHFDETRVRWQEKPTSAPYVGDTRFAEYAIHNLLSNALKYSPADREVFIRLHRLPQETVIEIVDQGTGMSPETIARVGEKFYRNPNTAHIEGTGLGLYLTKRFMDYHQGRLEFESTSGKGTTARLVFPLGPVSSGPR